MPLLYMIEKLIALFHASWCGHCKDMLPEWVIFKQLFKKYENKLGKAGYKYVEYEGSSKNLIAQSKNVTKDDLEMLKKVDPQGFPTIKIFKGNVADEHNGARTAYAFFTSLGPEIFKLMDGGDVEKIKKVKSGGGDGEEDVDGDIVTPNYGGENNFDQCGGGNQCSRVTHNQTGGRRLGFTPIQKNSKNEEYYKMKYFKYKAKYIGMKEKYGSL